MEAVFQADLVASKTIDRAGWRRRGLGERAQELKVNLIKQLL